jgi:Beta-lactamase
LPSGATGSSHQMLPKNVPIYVIHITHNHLHSSSAASDVRVQPGAQRYRLLVCTRTNPLFLISDMVSSIHHPDTLDKLLAGLTDPAAPRNKAVPGIALVIRSKDGRIIYSQGKGSFDISTPAWLASCTKLVTPIALLQLVEKGLITLDEPVQRFLPQCDLSHVLVGFDGEGKPMLQPITTVVTLRNLLNHTNGYVVVSVKSYKTYYVTL